MQPSPVLSVAPRVLVPVGAVLAALSIALAAYASHVANAGARQPLFLASVMAFGHALAWMALAAQARHRLGLAALVIVGGGCLLFAGSLVGSHFLGWSTRLAPAGGSLMILGWLGYAINATRRQ